MSPFLSVKKLVFGICLTGVLVFTSTPVSACADSFSPLEISTAEELFAFSKAVNQGETFEKQTVVLKNDVDLKGKEFTPIGEFSCPYSFRGVFEGNGYTIKGLSITDEKHKKNNGFFGKLGGTVQNLTVEGSISGNCCGGITSHVVGHAQIINCASYVTLDANRGGGIGDNVATADVISCYSESTNRKKPAMLVSYQAHMVYRSASTGLLTDIEQTTSVESCLENAKGDLNEFFNENVRQLWRDGYLSCRTWKDNAPSGELFQEETTLQGKGTKSSPYLIETIDDFITFRNLVNHGETFRGKTVKQTADLDFSGLKNMPVGFYDTDFTFDGTYDGAGHKIENIHMDSFYHGGRNALFGNLSGIVKNVGMESGSISGVFANSIAFIAKARKATVVNCYSKLDLKGEVRSAAMTDNFVGLVVGCLYVHEPVDFTFAAYNVTTLAYSYHNGDTFIKEGTSEFEPIECYLFNELKEGELERKLYDNLPRVAEVSGVKLSSLYHLNADGSFGEKVKLSDYSIGTYLSAYRYELIALVAMVGAVTMLCVFKNRRDDK